MSIDANSSSVESDQKQPLSLIQTPIESNFINEFNKNTENVFWFKKMHDKYGDKLLNLSYPFVIERIINRLTSRKRSNEIEEHIEIYLNYYNKYLLKISNISNINVSFFDLLLKCWPIYMYGFDKQGHPVMYDEIASVDPVEIQNIIKENSNTNNNDNNDIKSDIYDNLCELLRQFRFKFYGKMWNQKLIQSNKYKKTIFKHILVMDLKKFSYYKIITNISIGSGSPLNLIKSIINDERLIYPQELYKLYLINAPWSFKLLWNVISKFISTQSHKKIKILGNNYLDEMLNDIEIDQIPKCYGGEGIYDIKFGDIAQNQSEQHD